MGSLPEGRDAEIHRTLSSTAPALSSRDSDRLSSAGRDAGIHHTLSSTAPTSRVAIVIDYLLEGVGTGIHRTLDRPLVLSLSQG